MEKIKEALAKVKSSKRTTTSTKPSQKQKATTTNSTASINADIGHIEYTTSTVFQMNAKQLNNNRIVSHVGNNADTAIFDSLRTQNTSKNGKE